MADETRRLLKIFGVAVTDFELSELGLPRPSSPRAVTKTRLPAPEGVTELCRELNTRWLETTQHTFEIENLLLARCADAAGRCQVVDQSGEIESARMEARE
jgi:hypothetical protein